MQKKDLRRRYLDKRNDMPAETTERASALIAALFLDWLSENPRIGCVHIFLPARGKNEVDTFRIISHLHEFCPSIKTVAPRVESGQRQLSHRVFSAETRLVPNKWGIPEPYQTETVDIHEIDLVLAPMLIFDKKGHRVGYGGGYYDAFLAECRPDTLKTGLCFFEPVELISDVVSYDIRLNSCITPARIWEFN